MIQRYAINLLDGRIVPFNEENERQTAYAEIPADVALAVGHGEIEWRSVVELVHKKRNNDPSFSWDAFDRLRNQQNIRRAKYEFTGDAPSHGDSSDEGKVRQVEISLAELKPKDLVPPNGALAPKSAAGKRGRSVSAETIESALAGI